jgi:hypothetical protein
MYAKVKPRKTKNIHFSNPYKKSVEILSLLKIYFIDRNSMNGKEGFYWAFFSSVYAAEIT